MKVLLIADPPAGDKVQRELEALGVNVDYRRGLRDKAMMSAVDRPGFDWALVMNAHSLGAALKTAARRHGTRFMSIPPGWTGVERVLRENHFFTDLDVERGAGATALTQRPFANIGDVVVAKEALEAARGAVKKVSVLAGPKPPDAPPAKVEPPLKFPETHEAAVKSVLKDPRSRAAFDQARTDLAVTGTAALVVDPPNPVVALRPDEQEVIRAAQETFTRAPTTTLKAFVEALRATGRYVSHRAEEAASAIRREQRAKVGLKPTGAEGYRKTTKAAFDRSQRVAPPAAAPAFTREQAAALIPAPPPPAAPAPAQETEDGLPKGVVAALDLAAQELRAAGLEGTVSITHEGEVDFDVAVRRRAAGKLRVGGPG